MTGPDWFLAVFAGVFVLSGLLLAALCAVDAAEEWRHHRFARSMARHPSRAGWDQPCDSTAEWAEFEQTERRP